MHHANTQRALCQTCSNACVQCGRVGDGGGGVAYQYLGAAGFASLVHLQNVLFVFRDLQLP